MVSVKGVVERVSFAAAGSDFGVVRLRVEEGGRVERVTVVGRLAGVADGETIEVDGDWEQHEKFGRQLRAHKLRVSAPTSAAGVQKFLVTFDGIGEVLAERIVGTLGDAALETIDREPWRVAQITGVGKARAEKLSSQLRARRDERESLAFLHSIGLGARAAERLVRERGTAIVAQLRHNPYRLIREVSGFGFRRADALAQALGVRVDAPERIAAALVHVAESQADDGHTRTPRELVEKDAVALLGIAPDAIVKVLDQLLGEGRELCRLGDEVGLARLIRIEAGLAAEVVRLLQSRPSVVPRAPKTAGLSTGQAAAIGNALGRPLSVITGGPGTGKTTIVRQLVESYQRARIALAAPTGRAARRLGEATGRDAQTVHRLLGWGQEGRNGPQHDREDPLEADLVVIDEASMLDVELALALFAAIPEGATVVLCGDVQQLPSVGPGQVLADLMASGRVPTTILTEVFRQSKESGIIGSAYRVLAGEVPEARAGTDFFWVQAEGERAAELCERIVRERMPEVYGLDPLSDVQLLLPMHRGVLGTEALNQRLQAALNPHGPEVRYDRRTLRRGDRVLVTRNDYERDVFNGDVGRIASIDRDADDLVLEVDGRRVHYTKNEASELELGYALTVHKSQGSEYPAVVAAVGNEHYVMLRRNLLYTAMTRARRLLVLVGSPSAVRRAVLTVGGDRRTTLATTLRG